MAMWPIWHIVAVRWPISAGIMVSLRLLMQFTKSCFSVMSGNFTSLGPGFHRRSSSLEAMKPSGWNQVFSIQPSLPSTRTNGRPALV